MNHERDVRNFLLELAGVKNLGINNSAENRERSWQMKKIREIVTL